MTTPASPDIMPDRMKARILIRSAWMPDAITARSWLPIARI